MSNTQSPYTEQEIRIYEIANNLAELPKPVLIEILKGLILQLEEKA